MRTVTLVVALLVLGATAKAQTEYQQTKPVVASPGGVLVFEIPLDGTNNSYYLACPTGKLSTSCTFNIVLDGTVHNGSVSSVVTQFPSPLNSGAFSFTWNTTDGLSGSDSGEGKWVLVGRYPHAEIASSTVTVN